MEHYQISLDQIKQIKKVTWGGLIVNFILSGFKFAVGIWGSSQAVIADAVHSVSDMATDIAVILGVRFWSAPPDRDHPYGHQRIEAIVTVSIGIALVSVAIGLGYNSLSTIHDGHTQNIGWIAVWGPVISIVCKELLYQWTVHVGRRVKSSAVIANAWHHRSDALSSIPALFAVLISVLYPDWSFVDHFGAVVISIFILKVSWDIIVPALQELSDTGASLKTQNQIKEIALNVAGVKDAHAIRSRKLGARLHVDLHILVDPNLTVRVGHAISENVKQQLINFVSEVVDVVVHLEPFEEGEKQ